MPYPTRMQQDNNNNYGIGAWDNTNLTVRPVACDANGNLLTSSSQTAPDYVAPVTTSTSVTNQTISVGNSATSLLGVNTARHGFIICNNGTFPCYIGFTSGVTSGSIAEAGGGFLLSANGGMYTDTPTSWTGVVYAICPTGTTVVAVQEW